MKQRERDGQTDLGSFLDEEVYPALFERLDAAFPEFHWVQKGGHWVATSWPPDFPYPVGDRHPDRLMVYPDRPWWIKVHGHSGVRFLDYVNGGRKPEGPEFIEAVRTLATLAGVALPEREVSEEEREQARKREVRRSLLEAASAYGQEVLWSPRGKEAWRYLQEERGFTEAEVGELGFGFYDSTTAMAAYLHRRGHDLEAARNAGLLWQALEGYVLIPWADATGHPLTLYTRWPAKLAPAGKSKTLALPGEGTKASPLYFDRARGAGHKEVVLVEGVFDAALLQVRGDTRVVAAVAAQLSGYQVETLVRYRTRTVFICGDPDGGGDRGTVANIDALNRVGIATYAVSRLPAGLDPDEFVLRYGIERWQQHVAQAVPGTVFRGLQLLGDVSPASPPHERREAVVRCVEYEATLRGDQVALDREDLFRLTVERTGYSYEALTELAQGQAARRRWEETENLLDQLLQHLREGGSEQVADLALALIKFWTERQEREIQSSEAQESPDRERPAAGRLETGTLKNRSGESGHQGAVASVGRFGLICDPNKGEV
jgi:DNA primase